MGDRLKLAEAREELAEQHAQARAITQSLNALQGGKPETAYIKATKDKLLKMEDKVCEKQLQLSVEIERLEGTQLSASASDLPGPALAATSPSAAGSTKEPPRKTQRTLANWVLVKSSEDSLVFKKLDDPLLIASHPCPVCSFPRTRAKRPRPAAQEAAVMIVSPSAQSVVSLPAPLADSSPTHVVEGEDQLPLDVDVDPDRNKLADETVDESAWRAGPPIAPVGFALANAPLPPSGEFRKVALFKGGGRS